MNTLDAIAARRSIRKFKDTPIPDEMLNCILEAAIQAPSGKNNQPWRFIVVKGDQRAEMVRLMREGIAQMKGQGDEPGQQRVVGDGDGTCPGDGVCVQPAGRAALGAAFHGPDV